MASAGGDEQSGMTPTEPDKTPYPIQNVPEQQPLPNPQQLQHPQQTAPEYGKQQPVQYPTQYPPQQQSGIPLTQPSGFQSQQPLQYPQVQPNAYVYPAQVTQPPVQQNIVHVTNQTTPNDYFGFALFVTLCCCLPFGMVALIKSGEVKSRSAAGDHQGAARASTEAKCWATVGLFFGVVWVAVATVVGFVQNN